MEEGSQTGDRIEGYLEKFGIIDTLRHALAQVGRCIYMIFGGGGEAHAWAGRGIM